MCVSLCVFGAGKQLVTQRLSLPCLRGPKERSTSDKSSVSTCPDRPPCPLVSSLPCFAVVMFAQLLVSSCVSIPGDFALVQAINFRYNSNN